METRNLLIQIALLILGAIILFKVFQMDANQKIIKNNINKSIEEVEFAEEKLAAAQDEITQLEKQILAFKNESKVLEAQKDSIVLDYRKTQEDDLEELEKIKDNIAKNNKELDRLRKLNEQFDSGGGGFPVGLLKSLMDEALENLKEIETK